MAKKTTVIPPKFPPPDEYHWRAGPYRAPAAKEGAMLHDEYRGDVKVDDFIKSPIPWPGAAYCKGRRESLLPILCGDLVRAVCEEDELTVSYYWKVTRYIVRQWKRVLTGAKTANGVYAALAIKRSDPEFRKRFGYR